MRQTFKFKPITNDCCQWSEDNQVAFTTHDSIQILTPSENGSHLDCTSIPATHISDLMHSSRHQSIENVESWYRSSTVFCDAFIQSCWSATGVSKENGCLLLAVTTTHRLPIFEPLADPAKGEWIEIHDLSKDIKRVHSGSSDTLSRLDNLESISCAWSDRCLTELVNPFSVIAVGSKFGTMTLHTFTNIPHSVSAIDGFESTWITKLAWSQWIVSKSSAHQPYTYLAVAGSNGRLKIYKVTLNEQEKSVAAELIAQLFEGNRAMISSLKFYDLKPNSDVKLAIAKAGSVAVWSCKPDQPSAQGVSMLSLRDQLSIAGFVWGIKGEELRVYTASGGLIVLSVTPSNGGLSLALVLDESKEFLEEVLEIQPEEDKAGEGKEKDDEEEEEEADSDDRKIVIYGASGSPNNIFDMVVYTTYNANDMTYKVYSHERCKILIRPGYESDDAEIMNDILVRFNGLVPWSISRGKRINSKILWDIIQRFGASHFKEDVPFMNRFRLELNLRDATGMEAVSLVESIDDLYREIFQDPDVQVSTLVSYSLLSQPALREEKVQGLQTLERQDFLTIYFVSDWFLRNQAVLSPLRVQVEDLLKTLSTKAPSEDERMSINRQLDRVISGSTDMLEARESCPACREPIRLESLSEASCPNGHIWSRCSLSLGLIGTPTFRSCSGCHVQCKVPDANDTSFTSQILRRFNACILCGCSFQKRGFEFPA